MVAGSCCFSHENLAAEALCFLDSLKGSVWSNGSSECSGFYMAGLLKKQVQALVQTKGGGGQEPSEQW